MICGPLSVFLPWASKVITTELRKGWCGMSMVQWEPRGGPCSACFTGTLTNVELQRKKTIAEGPLVSTVGRSWTHLFFHGRKAGGMSWASSRWAGDPCEPHSQPALLVSTALHLQPRSIWLQHHPSASLRETEDWLSTVRAQAANLVLWSLLTAASHARCRTTGIWILGSPLWVSVSSSV